MRILLVEDDESVAKILQKVLTDEHYAVDIASDGRAGWQLICGAHYELVILDVLLPELDGLALCRQLRAQNYTMPVLFVTALDASHKKIAGLNAGADDYITKPFELEELLARVRALMRRVQTAVVLTLQWGDLEFDVNSREVTYNNNTLSLTPKEHALLELFLRHPVQTFSRQAILDNLWSHAESPGEETVTSHIKGLRHKLKKAGAPTDFVETVYGVGYRLKPSAQEGSQATDSAAADLSAANRQETQAALATLWKSVKGRQSDRLEILQRAVEQVKVGHFSEEMREFAYRSAHSLTGVLGVFGFRLGSDIAKQIQSLLQGKAPISAEDQTQLQALIETLQKTLDDAMQYQHQIGQADPPPNDRSATTPASVAASASIIPSQQLPSFQQSPPLPIAFQCSSHEPAISHFRQASRRTPASDDRSHPAVSRAARNFRSYC